MASRLLNKRELIEQCEKLQKQLQAHKDKEDKLRGLIVEPCAGVLGHDILEILDGSEKDKYKDCVGISTNGTRQPNVVDFITKGGDQTKTYIKLPESGTLTLITEKLEKKKRFEVIISKFLKKLEIKDNQKQYTFKIKKTTDWAGDKKAKIYFFDNEFNEEVLILTLDVENHYDRTIYNKLKKELTDDLLLESINDYLTGRSDD